MAFVLLPLLVVSPLSGVCVLVRIVETDVMCLTHALNPPVRMEGHVPTIPTPRWDMNANDLLLTLD